LCKKISRVVSPGSVLRRLLFLTHINDITEASFHINLFAGYINPLHIPLHATSLQALHWMHSSPRTESAWRTAPYKCGANKQ